MLKAYCCIALLLIFPSLAGAAVNPDSNAQVKRLNTDAEGRASGLFELRGPITVRPAGVQTLSASSAGNPALQRALSFFADNQTLFGASPDELLLHRQTTDRFGHQHLRFYRTLGGIAIHDMELLVHLDREGTITSVNGEVVQASDALRKYMSTPRQLLPESDALARVAALRNVSADDLRLLSARQWLFNEAPHIRWHLDLNLVQGIGRFSYWLDAETGDVIEVQNTLRHPLPFNR